jgi:nitric oxide reductase large subunit
MKTNIKVYFKESSIHGFPYVVNRELHIVERVLWVVALLISFICCGFLIYEIGVKVQEDAMVTFTSDTAIAVTDVS